MIPIVHPIAIPTNKSYDIILPLNLVGKTGLEPVWIAPRDFKSLVYTNFTTFPCVTTKFLECLGHTAKILDCSLFLTILNL